MAASIDPRFNPSKLRVPLRPLWLKFSELKIPGNEVQESVRFRINLLRWPRFPAMFATITLPDRLLARNLQHPL